MKKKKYIILALSAICLFFAGGAFAEVPGTDWPQFQKTETNIGYTTDFAPVTSPDVIWSVFTHYRATHGIDVPAVIANGRVFTIDVNNYAWSFDLETGDLIWSTPLMEGTRFTLATPACGEGKVFFATSTGYIYALDESGGNILWSGKLTHGSFQKEELSTQIVYADGKVYVGSWEGVYYCLDAAGEGTDPKIIWSYTINDGGYDWWSGAAVIGDYILFGDTESRIVSLSKDTGALVNEINLSQQYEMEAGSIRSAITFNPSLNRIYLTSKNGYVYAIGFNTSTGNLDPSDG
jgi:outer membrane protein assembly factor BamB